MDVRNVPDTLKVSLCFLFSWRGPLLHGPGHATEFRTKRILTHEGPSDSGVSHAYTLTKIFLGAACITKLCKCTVHFYMCMSVFMCIYVHIHTHIDINIWA